MKCLTENCGHETLHMKTKVIGTGFMSQEQPECCEEPGCQCHKFTSITDEQFESNRCYHLGAIKK